MIRRLILPALVVLTAFSSLALVNKSRQPDSLYITGQIDFGTVGPGKHEQQFEISNPTSRKIVIKRALASCGCTMFNLKTPFPVLPGQRLQASIVFDANGQSGDVRKKLSFHTDVIRDTDDGPKSVTILTRLSAFVKNPPRPVLAPSILDFGDVGVWEEKAKHVYLHNAKLSPEEQSGEFFLIRSIPRSDKILVTLIPADEPGQLIETPSIQTTEGPLELELRCRSFESVFAENDILMLSERVNGHFERDILLTVPPKADLSTLSVDSDVFDVGIVDVLRIAGTKARASVVIAPRSKSCASGIVAMRLGDDQPFEFKIFVKE